jgi:transposase-like protein
MKKTPRSEPKGKIFDEEFKRDVASLASQPNANMRLIANELGVGLRSVKRWKAEFGANLSGGGAILKQPCIKCEDQTRHLKGQVNRLTAQNDILKKAIAILSPTGGLQ